MKTSRENHEVYNVTDAWAKAQVILELVEWPNAEIQDAAFHAASRFLSDPRLGPDYTDSEIFRALCYAFSAAHHKAVGDDYDIPF